MHVVRTTLYSSALLFLGSFVACDESTTASNQSVGIGGMATIGGTSGTTPLVGGDTSVIVTETSTSGVGGAQNTSAVGGGTSQPATTSPTAGGTTAVTTTVVATGGSPPATCKEYAVQGNCASTEGTQQCLSGAWTTADCGACKAGIVSCASYCCQIVTAFAVTNSTFSTPLPDGVTSFVQGEDLVAFGALFNFTAPGQIGVIQLRFGAPWRFYGAYVRTTLTANTTATVNYVATLENSTGTAGCKYSIPGSTGGSFTSLTTSEYDTGCWGGYMPFMFPTDVSLVEVLNLRYEATSAGVFGVMVSEIDLDDTY